MADPEPEPEAEPESESLAEIEVEAETETGFKAEAAPEIGDTPEAEGSSKDEDSKSGDGRRPSKKVQIAVADLRKPSVEKKNAIKIRHAYKHYGRKKNSNHVFVDLNMTVEKGTIYGLLGASGCGKTTLLSCIVGRKKLNKGIIRVLGGIPGTKGSAVPGKRVGYMPQEIALYGEFTIKETMMYFGWIFGMKSSEIKLRLAFLLEFLELPSDKRMIKNLSGGQQRRVSFAVALLQDPELIILDEPTVGVDPVLRQNIWNYLVQLTQSGDRTVIITTHYIEEARQANTIGLMRSGELLAEESPQYLLAHYKTTTLEEVFLMLSRKQIIETFPEAENELRITVSDLQVMRKRTQDTRGEENTDLPRERRDSSFTESFENLTTWGKIKALLQKNFLRMWRNIGMLLFIFVLPILQVILFCLAIGRDPINLAVGVVNDEIKYTNKDQKCPYQLGCTNRSLSCRYLDNVDKDTINQMFYPNVSEALKAVEQGAAWGVMYFTMNFTDALLGRMALGQDVDKNTLFHSKIHVRLDMSNQQIAMIIQRDLQFAFQKFTYIVLTSCHKNPGMAVLPINYGIPIYGSNKPLFTDFVAPGVILTIIFFLALALTSSTLIAERSEGMLDRSWVAGVTSAEILLSHVLTQFIVMCGQTALVLIFMHLLFGIKIKGDIAWVVTLTILQGLCGMSFGFVISAICEFERDAIQLTLGSFYPMLLMSGILWPIEGMPTILRYVATFLPLTMATTALRAMLSKGWGIFHQDVYFGFISTLSWIMVFLSVTLILLRKKKD